MRILVVECLQSDFTKRNIGASWAHEIRHVSLIRWFLQIVNPKGEMKGSAITGPVGKEAAELWPVRCIIP